MAIKSTSLSPYEKKNKQPLEPYFNSPKASTKSQTMDVGDSAMTATDTPSKPNTEPSTPNIAQPNNPAINTPGGTTTGNNSGIPSGSSALANAYGGSYSAQRQNALSQAEANYNKLLRYLPEYNELMGMSGLGVSSQALLNAYGKYQNNINDINTQYDELEKAHAEQYRNNVNMLSGELSAYIEESGKNFDIDKYNERKQAYINSGMYTAEELAAAEALLTDEQKININDLIFQGKKELQVSIGGKTRNINLRDADQVLDGGEFFFGGKPSNGDVAIADNGYLVYYNGKSYAFID